MFCFSFISALKPSSPILPSASVVILSTVTGLLPSRTVKKYLGQLPSTFLFISTMIWWLHCGCTPIVTSAGYFAPSASGTLAEFAQFAFVVEGNYFLPGCQIFCKHIPGLCGRGKWRLRRELHRLLLYCRSHSAGMGLSRGKPAISRMSFNFPLCAAISFSFNFLTHFQLDSVVFFFFAKQMMQGRSSSWRTAVSEHQLMQCLCCRGQEQGYD